MLDYQNDFIQFALDEGVLRFGEFELKSGRLSPYFFNTGLFNHGAALARLGEIYARAIVAEQIQFDMLYGPAYKGIPLGSAIAISLARNHNVDVPFCFNRKEIKDHGEGGATLGAPLSGDVLIVDDVISAGTSVRESTEVIANSKARAAAVMISLDRQERGQENLSAVDEVKQRYKIPVHSIVKLAHIIDFLKASGSYAAQLDAVERYRAKYGA